jgi:Flp pilus assembly protein TadG
MNRQFAGWGMRMNTRIHRNSGTGGVFARLRRNRAGNTLAMMAIGIIPLAGLVGGAVDMSRMYLTKTRLQQACDAGALAGRKVMGGGTWAASSYAGRTAANQFFDGNFQDGDYGTSDLTKTYTESAGKVSGTASAKVPMTLMKIFKQGTETLTVNCDAEMRLPNTDVMFVLDTTGSMGETLSGDNKTKMAGLRIAVKCFYEIVARLDTNVTCDGGAPSGGTGDQVQVRFGFVPFSTNVNVGKLLPSNWFADRWTYQSREQTTVWGKIDDYSNSGTSSGDNILYEETNQSNDADCVARMPADTDPAAIGTMGLAKNWDDDDWEATQRMGWKDYSRNFNNKVCKIYVRERAYTRTNYFDMVPEGTANAVPFKSWRYKPVQFDLTPLKSGSGWNSSITLPTGDGFVDKSINWNGCIEERQTVRRTNYSPIESIKADAIDLDIDRTPDGNEATQWAPALGGLVYPRKSDYRKSSAWRENEITTFTNYDDLENYDGIEPACPTESRKMRQWEDASAFDTYVDSLRSVGNTYHDIGLLWGGRLLSPSGLFRAENEFTPKGGEIERHLIFMTDGDACTANTNYQAYGLSWYDRRTTDPDDVPTGGCTTDGTLTEQVNARTAALCEAVRNKNITLWVIWFGEKKAYIEGAMKACASPDRFFSARNSTELQKTFRSIADQISQLRLTK